MLLKHGVVECLELFHYDTFLTYLETALFPNQNDIIAANKPAVLSSQIRLRAAPTSRPLFIRAITAVTLMATKSPKNNK